MKTPNQNASTIIITGPGIYKTRGGKTATVERVRKDAENKAPHPFPAIGSISHHTARGGHTTTRAAWHVSGRTKFDKPHSTDIIKKEE